MPDLTKDDLVYALAAPALTADGNIPFFAAKNSGLYCSDDGGLTWQDAYQSLTNGQPMATFSIALGPNFEQTPLVIAGVSGGVVRSVDACKSWHSAVFPKPAPLVVSLAISPNYKQDKSVFAGTAEDGVFISADGGMTWASWNFGLLDANILCLAISPDFARDETLFAGTSTAVFVSTNGGRSWRELDLPQDLAVVLSLAVSPHFAQDQLLFVGTEEDGLFQHSGGSGKTAGTWQKLAADQLIGEPVNAIILGGGPANIEAILVLAGERVLISTDQGATFEPWISAELSPDDETVAVAAPQGLSQENLLLVGGMSGDVHVVQAL